MAKTQPTGDLRGVLIPEAGTLTATYTATTQAGPRAGAVVPDQVTGLLLHASGTLDANSEAAQGGTMGITTLTGGNVGTAAIRWAFSGDTLRSWDPPVMISGWEYIDRSTVASRYVAPHVIRRASDGLPVVVVTKNTNDVVVNYADSLGIWTAVTAEATSAQTRACLVDLPSGRLLCLYVVAASSRRPRCGCRTPTTAARRGRRARARRSCPQSRWRRARWFASAPPTSPARSRCSFTTPAAPT